MSDIKFITNKSFEEIYDVKNSICPICNKKFPNAIISIVKVGGKAYHLDCYDRLLNK